MDFSDRLERCYSGAVYDVLRVRGLSGQVLPVNIRPLNGVKKLAGPVFTAAIVEQVIGEVEVAMETENLVRKGIRDGMDPQEAYLRYGKF